MLRADVDDATAEDVDQFADLTTSAVFGADLHQHQVSFDEVFAGEIFDSNNGDDLLKLLADLAQLLFIFVHDERDTRQLGIFGGTHRQAVNVVRAGRPAFRRYEPERQAGS